MRLDQIPLLCLASVLALAALAVAQEVDRDDVHDREAKEADAGDFDPDESLQTGFVFIDGEFLAAPYRVTLSEDGNQVLINDREVPGAIPKSPPGMRPFGGRSRNRQAGDREAGGRQGGFGWRPRPTEPPRGVWAGRIRQHLEVNAAIVAFTDQRLQILRETQTYSLLSMLLQKDVHSKDVAEVMEIPAGPRAAATWDEWLREFQPPAALRRQAEPLITTFEAAEAENLARIAAVRRFDAVAYPLTLLGMLLSVIAFGHLLMSLPNSREMRKETSDGTSGISREVVRATMISVVLVAALSSLDLVWTLLASQAGQMLELNPIASHFINDPLSLIAFKAAATLLGCGLLFALRRHSRAQLASWWMCLICTMLTFRWLVFNSMFVT